MNTSLITGTVLGTLVAASSGAAIHYAGQNEHHVTDKELIQLQTQASLNELAKQEQTSPKVSSTKASATMAKPPQPTPSFARVIGVNPIEEIIEIPREECHDEIVTHTEPVKDKHQMTGIISGALIGGILGHQVGDGRGKDLATVAGAAAGAYGGKKTQQKIQQSRTWTTTEQRCETVTDTRVKIRGYNVRYEINGQLATVRMDYDPGKRIPLNNGNLMI